MTRSHLRRRAILPLASLPLASLPLAILPLAILLLASLSACAPQEVSSTVAPRPSGHVKAAKQATRSTPAAAGRASGTSAKPLRCALLITTEGPTYALALRVSNTTERPVTFRYFFPFSFALEAFSPRGKRLPSGEEPSSTPSQPRTLEIAPRGSQPLRSAMRVRFGAKVGGGRFMHTILASPERVRLRASNWNAQTPAAFCEAVLSP